MVSVCTHCSVCISQQCHARRRCLFFQPLRCRKLLKSFQVVPALVLWMSKSQACGGSGPKPLPEHCIKVALSSIQNGLNVSRSHTIGCVYCDRGKNSISSFLDRPSCNPAVYDQALTGRNQPIQGQPCLSDQGCAVTRVVDATLFQRRHIVRGCATVVTHRNLMTPLPTDVRWVFSSFSTKPTLRDTAAH